MLMFLLFGGAGCGTLWDQYFGDDDSAYDRSRRREFERAMDERDAKEDEARRAEQAAKDALRPKPSQTYLDLATKTPDEIRALEQPLVIPVLTLDGEMFPFPDDQFRKSEPDECKEVHYHGPVGFTYTRKQVPQPETPCGFGSAVTMEEVDTEELIRWMQEGPKAVKLKW